jgi:hypothetical protein
MALITNSDALLTMWEPPTTGPVRGQVSGGEVRLQSRATSGSAWVDCALDYVGATLANIDVRIQHDVPGVQYRWLTVSGTPVVRADQ